MAHRYAREEHERRFLLRAAPDAPATRFVELEDRYLVGTTLRLRRAVERGGPSTFKLTQKRPRDDGGIDLTTFYLREDEHARLCALPARVVTKTRHAHPPYGVDVFVGVLAGLVLAEVETETAASLGAAPLPPGCVREVSQDPRFTGGALAATDAAALRLLLAEHGVVPEA